MGFPSIKNNVIVYIVVTVVSLSPYIITAQLRNIDASLPLLPSVLSFYPNIRLPRLVSMPSSVSQYTP